VQEGPVRVGLGMEEVLLADTLGTSSQEETDARVFVDASAGAMDVWASRSLLPMQCYCTFIGDLHASFRIGLFRDNSTNDSGNTPDLRAEAEMEKW